jgi:hypothetical protein
MIDLLIQHIAQNSNCSNDEAAECLIRGIFQKFEESIAYVTIEKGVFLVKPKMSKASIEAMLSEAIMNTENARTLFRHLNQFFGRSYFASEQKR